MTYMVHLLITQGENRTLVIETNSFILARITNYDLSRAFVKCVPVSNMTLIRNS